MKILNKIFLFLSFIGIVYTALSLSGCAMIFGSARNVTIITQQDSTKVTLIPSHYHGHDHTRTVTINGRVGHVKLKTGSQFYEIQQECPGYYNKSTSASANSFNAWKLMDIGIPLLCDVVLIANSHNPNTSNPNASNSFENGSLYHPVLDVGTFGWFDIFFGHWKTFKGTYTLPALEKVPSMKKADSAKKVYVKNVSITIPKDSMVELYYKSDKDFKSGKLLRKDNLEGSFHERHTVFRDSLNDYLMKWNYIDTARGFFSFVYRSACYIRCNIDGLTINTIGNTTVFRVRSEWKLYGVTGDKEIYRTTLTGEARQENFYVSDFMVSSMMTTALAHSLTQFLDLDTVSHCLSSRTANMKGMTDWDTLRFSSSGRATNLQEAVKAVVTVKVPDGHGSGCIISSDGYLVTNYHVIADDTTDEVKIIDSDGDSLKAKYVRSNTSYDLALFKMEKPGPYKFFGANLSTDINVGTEVYAIGTPTDIALGQTMTRGIISSKRKIGDRTLIQTDVSINPGNSGGGLVDTQGTLQGIVNASLIRYGVQGIGFAIPAHYIQDALKVKFIQQ